MDPEPLEPAKMDDRARRARTILAVVMAAFIMAPIVLYFVVGSGFAPRR
jgi:hypothetical protein